MPACACSSTSSGRGHSFSTASRSRCNEPTPGFPPQENTSFDGAAGADQLIVDDVRRHADERQVLALLPDDFVAGGERNQVREALEGDGVAVVHEFFDGVSELKDGSQRSIPAVCVWFE